MSKGMTLHFKGSKGEGALVAVLEQLGERAEKNGARGLERAAKRVQKNAVLFAPLDHGGLEEAILIDEDKDAKRRRRFYVFVDPNAPELDEDGNPTKRRVGRYMLFAHESTQSGTGKRSIQKSRETGAFAGYKFMERALREENADSVAQEVGKEIKGGLG